MAANPNFNVTPEEYLQIEREAEFKSEYIDGVMYAMAGSSPPHSLISGNILTEINIQLPASEQPMSGLQQRHESARP